MGISGIFKEIGPGTRTSLLALSATHQSTHHRPLRLAIDTSIWLFQILASKGGSNPALRTFYYRLLRLLAHNIHPLFVFDGPNKPTFKRNKKVGGPGVRVASVPEFLAKQLLKEFGFPWHVAPGEAEAECARLQREGVVDVVMSEDVDTLMFGSGVTIRNWTAQGKGKVPTHVDVFRAEETKEKSGLDREGMILVALMSGGDYIVEGIPGCGPRVACDAARAGFGRELCEIAARKDVAGLKEWRERLQHEINTNESKFFTRKNKLQIPDDFPSREVLGYYTHPCVSPPDKIERLRETLRWDQEIDFVALRNFTADAFDWRCISGAKKFVRNLAPAMLVRRLRLRKPSTSQDEIPSSTYQEHVALEIQQQQEKLLVSTIHSKRTHVSTDNSLEYRISFTPMSLVPIDLSIEDEDDQLLPPVDADEPLSEADNEWATIASSTAGEDDDEDIPATKTRGPSLYDPTKPEKLWLLADFLRAGCPVMVRMFEDGTSDPKAILKARREARAKAKEDGNIHAKKSKKKAGSDMPANALLAYTTTTKSSQVSSKDDDGEDVEITRRVPLKDLSPRTAGIKANKLAVKKKSAPARKAKDSEPAAAVFRRMSSQMLRASQITTAIFPSQDVEEEDDDPTPKPIRRTTAPKPAKSTASETNSKTNTKVVDTTRPFKQFAKTTKKDKSKPLTPRRNKRSSNDIEEDLLSSAKSQRTIDSYWTPTPKKAPPPPPQFGGGVIDLVSSSPAPPPFPFAGRTALEEGGFLREEEEIPLPLPMSVTKRKARRPLKRAKTAPVAGGEDSFDLENVNAGGISGAEDMGVEAMDLASPSPVRRRQVVVDEIPVPSPPRFSVGMPPPPSPQASRTIPPVVRPVAAAPLRRSPRASELARASSSASILTMDVPKGKTKKQRIQLRESLEGSWRYVEADMLDLTGDVAGGEKVHGKGRLRSWRESGVEVLDLTED